MVVLMVKNLVSNDKGKDAGSSEGSTEVLIKGVGGSNGPATGAVTLGQSLDLLGQMITDAMKIFASLGVDFANIKITLSQQSLQHQNNFSATNDENNSSGVAPPGVKTINILTQEAANGTLSDDDSKLFGPLETKLNAIISKYQGFDNQVSPLITLTQNTTQGLPSSYSEILSADSAPLTQGQSTLTQLLMKGI
jgi:hypothetical protein